MPAGLPTLWAIFTFCDGMTREQRRFTIARFYPESPSIALDEVDRADMPDEVPRTWITTKRDRIFAVKSQHASIEAVGVVQKLISIDTCHDLMISTPNKLAEILVERCRRYT